MPTSAESTMRDRVIHNVVNHNFANAEDWRASLEALSSFTDSEIESLVAGNIPDQLARDHALYKKEAAAAGLLPFGASA